jgi:hypothetical protein
MSCSKIEFSMPSGTPLRRLFAITSAQAIQLRNGEMDELCSFRRSKSRIEPESRSRWGPRRRENPFPEGHRFVTKNAVSTRRSNIRKTHDLERSASLRHTPLEKPKSASLTRLIGSRHLVTCLPREYN